MPLSHATCTNFKYSFEKKLGVIKKEMKKVSSNKTIIVLLQLRILREVVFLFLHNRNLDV